MLEKMGEFFDARLRGYEEHQLNCIDAHHASPMMVTIAALREKYDLHMTVERYVSTEENDADERFIRK